MPIFVCRYAGDESPAMVVVDAATEAEAREAARAVHEDNPDGRKEPDDVRELPPRAFVAECVFDEEEGAMVLHPWEHTEEVLFQLDQGEEPTQTVCGVEAEDEEGHPLVCGESPGHDGRHRDADDPSLTWDA